jgi:hypothetical protein
VRDDPDPCCARRQNRSAARSTSRSCNWPSCAAGDPALKITDRGMVDVDAFEIIDP